MVIHCKMPCFCLLGLSLFSNVPKKKSTLACIDQFHVSLFKVVCTGNGTLIEFRFSVSSPCVAAMSFEHLWLRLLGSWISCFATIVCLQSKWTWCLKFVVALLRFFAYSTTFLTSARCCTYAFGMFGSDVHWKWMHLQTITNIVSYHPCIMDIYIYQTT